MQEAPIRAAGADIDGSWFSLVAHWRLVSAELLGRGIDIRRADVLDGPWLSVRTAIFDLLDSPTRLRMVLTRR